MACPGDRRRRRQTRQHQHRDQQHCPTGAGRQLRYRLAGRLYDGHLQPGRRSQRGQRRCKAARRARVRTRQTPGLPAPCQVSARHRQHRRRRNRPPADPRRPAPVRHGLYCLQPATRAHPRRLLPHPELRRQQRRPPHRRARQDRARQCRGPHLHQCRRPHRRRATPQRHLQQLPRPRGRQQAHRWLRHPLRPQHRHQWRGHPGRRQDRRHRGHRLLR